MENEFQQLLNFLVFFIFINFLFLIFNKKISKLVNINDQPDSKRKLHRGNPSLIGGIYLFLNIILFYFIVKSNYFINVTFFPFKDISLLISLILIFLIGIFDDKYDLKANSKLALLCIAVLVSITTNNNFLIENIQFTSFQRDIYLYNFSYFFTLLCILLFMNSFNMMDGTNSLAGLYSIIFLIYFLIFVNFSVLTLVLIIFLIFYLYLNYRNLIFFGDSGSLLLSFLISMIVIFNHNSGNMFAEEIFILMIIPGLDMFRLFLTRIFNKKNPFSGDRNHLHHLLLNVFDNKQTVCIYNGFFILILILFNIIDYKLLFIIIIMVCYSISIYFLLKFKKKKIS